MDTIRSAPLNYLETVVDLDFDEEEDEEYEQPMNTQLPSGLTLYYIGHIKFALY